MLGRADGDPRLSIMGAWLDRYQRGQRAAVWTEMISLGTWTRNDAESRADAQQVAALTMQRARYNVEVLIGELSTAGYQFDPPPGQQVFQPPHPHIAAELDELETEVGVLPLALRAWYEQVGQVNLVGAHPAWPNDELDPLVVDAPIEFIRSEFHEWQEVRGTAWSQDRAFTIDIAPDRLHKADISGGPPYGVTIPNDGIDGLVLFEEHQTTFSNYLRIAFRWAGMPGLSRPDAPPLDPDTVAAIRRCGRGLLPI